MNLQITRVGDAIAVYKDYKDIDGRGELAHVITELECLKQELLLFWLQFGDEPIEDGR